MGELENTFTVLPSTPCLQQQNQRISRAGRDPQGPSSPSPGTTQVHPTIRTTWRRAQSERFLNAGGWVP